ncbi:hypothetical protein [Halopelagius fulvigenes]|uniref:Uncharacterized protein n=1 Tax=Halopelagius fulvigenes TaxID=1198324 RepID=A0ABD5TXN9_9EURY
MYADVFNESYDDVHVKASMKPPEEKYRSLIAQIQAGNAPEVLGLDVIYLPRFVELDTLANLDSFYQELSYTDGIFKPLTVYRSGPGSPIRRDRRRCVQPAAALRTRGQTARIAPLHHQ